MRFISGKILTLTKGKKVDGFLLNIRNVNNIYHSNNELIIKSSYNSTETTLTVDNYNQKDFEDFKKRLNDLSNTIVEIGK